MVGVEGDVGGIRIIPPLVEFVDAIVNERYALSFTVQNISKFSRKIRFHPPITDESPKTLCIGQLSSNYFDLLPEMPRYCCLKFRLIVKNPEKSVAPGLEVTAIVEYENDKTEDARDRILLSVDEDVVEVPLYAYMPTPLLDIEGPVDFGLVVANSRIVSQEVALINHGSIKGSFSIKYNGTFPIVISPVSGDVNPKTIQLIKVDLATEKPFTMNETAIVQLEGMKDTKLEIKGRVVEQFLELLESDKKTRLERVAFGPAFYGTDRLEYAYLFNSGPEPVKWVSVLEEGVDGEEAGTDLTKSTLAMLATSPLERIRGRAYDVLTSLVSVFPNQGTIGPYQKIPICFRFSPRFISSSIGWDATEKPPPRQDFALFMTFSIVGSSDTFQVEEKKVTKKVEIAVTATAVPVLVNIQPSNTYDFGEIHCGDGTSTLCNLSNESALLPINIRARKVAQFNVIPHHAKIAPGKSQDIIISFQPNQAGIFQSLQIFDVVGKVCGNEKTSIEESPTSLVSKSFQTLPLQLMGKAVVPPKPLAPKFNPGITPLHKNEVGLSSEVAFNELHKARGQLKPDIFNATKSSLHSQQKNSRSPENSKALVAFPNDRPSSVRPSQKGEKYQTPYTRVDRHHYVDPDYAYTVEEERIKSEHRNKYKSYLRDQALKRRENEKSKEFIKINNETDLAMKPASGIHPPKLLLSEMDTEDAFQVSPIKEKHRLLTTRQLMTQQQQTLNRPVSEGLNAVPTTAREKADCRRHLTPQDLHKIVIGPPTVDFGTVCLRSTNHKQLHVVNNLDHYIHVQMMINCKELRQTSPLSQVVPPRSKAQFTLVFESDVEGKFQRSISYSVNSQHESHVLILAEIVPVNLELSHSYLELTPGLGLPAEAGYRSTVTVRNRRNYPAEFTWSPILTDRGTAFSIRPATGIVDAYKDLQCEVVFHPSYFAPLEGEFHMQVHNGNSLKLKCTAKLGSVNVKFTERRVLFGNVPLNMVTTKKAILQNVGQNHAMFYVINSSPFPGMTVSPTHGVVPVGGHAEFKIALNPTAVVKFDTWIQVNIRGWRTIEVRLGGTVEPPEVDIDIKAFKFHGVYCHSTATIPFSFINLSTTRVCAEIDLTKYSDFSLTFPGGAINNDPEKMEIISPHRYEITLRGGQTLPCVLNFNPSSIASYDFTLPVVLNKTGAPSPPPSTFPPTPAPSEHPIVTPRQIVISIPTPRRRVQATALKPVLDISTSNLDFYLPPHVMSMHLSENAKGDQKDLVFTNRGDQPLHWELGIKDVKGFLENCSFSFIKPGGAWFNLDNVSGVVPPHEQYTLTINFNPSKTGTFTHVVPLYIQQNKSIPYRQITLKCSIEAPQIVFDPLALVLTPVPLATAVYAEFNLIATGYLTQTSVTYKIPDVEADDGSKVKCFDLEFPEGSVIPAPKIDSLNEKIHSVLPCVLTFTSEKPLSVTVDVTISDAEKRKYTIPVTATADNCLLTVYPFLAAHRTDHQIVREQDKTLKGLQREDNSASLGEAILLPCTSPLRPSTQGSTSVTSSRFDASSSSYVDSTNSVSESDTGSTSPYSNYYDPRASKSSGVVSLVFKSVSFRLRAAECDFIASRDGVAQPIMPDNSDVTATPKRPLMSRQLGNKNALLGRKVVTGPGKEIENAVNYRELISRSLGSAAFPFESTLEAHFHHEVLNAVQRWFSSYGWSGGPFPVTVPYSIRRLFTRSFNDDTDFVKPKHSEHSGMLRSSAKPPISYSSLKKDVKTVYDMLFHLCGRAVPGISQNQQLPLDRTEKVIQLHWQHSTLLSFLRGQGASVAAIRPEFLFAPADYLHWVKVRRRDNKPATAAEVEEEEADDLNQPTLSSLQIEEDLFESVSKRAWTDLLLQIYKVLVLSRINSVQYASMKPTVKDTPFPKVNPDAYVSNVYSVGERIILTWLNYHYTHQRQLVWGNASEESDKMKGGIPPSRWVVNFDYDLLDGLVLASSLAAYCPWLIADYFVEMYTAPSSPEQCLHNTLILVKAMRSIGIDYDIQATDITDPNPINLLMLCVHLYQNLPHYLVKTKVQFDGPLHTDVLKQIRLSNTSSRPLKYLARISGRDADDFKLPKGEEITVPARSATKVDVIFKSRFLRPTEAVLVFVGIRSNYDVNQQPGTVGTTLVFLLNAAVSNVTPVTTIRVETPCYEMQKVIVPVVNPFSEPALFRVILLESGDALPSPLDAGATRGADRSSSKTLSSRIKSVRSRTDHGQPKEESPPPSPPTELQYAPHTKSSSRHPRPTMTPQLTAFYCHQREIYLESQQATNLELEFLPFKPGKKYCSLLFIHEKVGEFLYAVEGLSTQPLPSIMPANPKSKNSVPVSNPIGIVHGKNVGSENIVLHFKCENKQTLQDFLLIPVTNTLKEQALQLAARQRMSKKEMQRRKLTGTLDSGSVTAFIASMGMLDVQDDGDRENLSSFPLSLPPPRRSVKFSVEATCPWFKLPNTFTIPSPLTFGPKLASDMIRDNSGPNDRQDDGYVSLPFGFDAQCPGHYPCDVILRSSGDVRVYKIACTVNPAGTTALFKFNSPAHQSITQNIPIQNTSNHDWELDCTIKGDGFEGPSQLIAKAGQTMYYPLTFKPNSECSVTGQLLIKNKTGTQHVFSLTGVGESPMALDHIVIPCKCRQTTLHTVNVPNYAPHKLVYKVITDIPCLDGDKLLCLMKGQSAKYTFTVSPWQRGKLSGILAFVADDLENAQQLCNEDSDDSDDKADDSSNSNDDKVIRPIVSMSRDKETPAYLKPQPNPESGLSSFRVWYTIDLEVDPPDPIGVIEVECPVQSSREIEIPIKNPTGERVEFEVTIDNDLLEGESKLLLVPRIPASYKLLFAPSLIGDHETFVIFNSPQTGEFWYKLILHSVSPSPTQLPKMDCQLGRWSRQYIEMQNPSDELMKVEADLSNPINFSLDVPIFSSGDQENSPLVFHVQPRSAITLPLQFIPTTLGSGNHQTKLTLKSKQLGKAVYLVAGRGVAPKPMEPISVSAAVGSSTSLILPFRNPTDVPVLVDISLTDIEKTLNSISDSVVRNNITIDSAFCLLLKQSHGIRLAGRQNIDIPFTFCPDTMRKFEGSLAISIRREDGQSWPDENEGFEDFVEHPRSLSQSPSSIRKTNEGTIKFIRYVFPVHGIPEVRSNHATEAMIKCQARSRIEERLEVTLTGAMPGVSSAHELAKIRAVSPFDKRPHSQSTGVIVEGRSLAEEFSFKLDYPKDDDTKQHLEQSLAVNLVRKDRDPHTGMVILVFNLVFSPFREMNEKVLLNVTSATGGVWSFPILVHASEPPADDVIYIEAAGIGKGSTVSFTLFSQTTHTTPFSAFFVNGSDKEFIVNPSSGELQPQGTSGTRLSVTFTPKIYGRSYKARLVVQTLDMQWAYDIKGVPPGYRIPLAKSAISHLTKPARVAQRPRINFIRENLKLNTTAVSSPIKGFPLCAHIKTK